MIHQVIRDIFLLLDEFFANTLREFVETVHEMAEEIRAERRYRRENEKTE